MLLTNMFFNFGRKKTENLSFKNGHFLTICGHFYGIYFDIFPNISSNLLIGDLGNCVPCLINVFIEKGCPYFISKIYTNVFLDGNSFFVTT